MRRRKLAGAALVAGGLLAGVGCSLINTDDLTGGLASTTDAGHLSKDASSDARVDSGPPIIPCDNDGGTPGLLGDTNNCGACGHLCGANIADTTKSPNYCSGTSADSTCMGVEVSLAGQGRQIAQFSGYGLVWSTVTQSGGTAGSCAVVAPTIYGIASSSVDSNSLFMVSTSTGAAYYASGLASDIHGITYQDTNPAAGENVREVGFGTMKQAGILKGEIHGLFEPPQETVLYFFSNDSTSPGPHEWTASGVGNDPQTNSIALDPTAPQPSLSPYETVAMAADATWLYYGEADGVFRIRGGAICDPLADAGVGASDGGDDGGATASSCEGLFIPIGLDADGAALTVTSLLVDDQYIFVATSDGLLTRYQTIDGANPMQLSTQGPFYGLTQDVTLESSTVQFGTRVFASSAAGSILEISKSGGEGSSVVLATSSLTPMGITVDSAGVYWVEDGTQNTEKHCAVGDGRVMRVSRPVTEP